jgi:hypothetical protein
MAESKQDEIKQDVKKAATSANSATLAPRKRVPLGSRNILTAPKKKGFVRRFVNDKGDRVQAFKDAGWTPVEDTPVGDPKLGRASSIGSLTNPSVGAGQRAILMEIPEQYYEEDYAAAQAEITAVENEIKRKSKSPGKDGLAGEVKIS